MVDGARQAQRLVVDEVHSQTAGSGIGTFAGDLGLEEVLELEGTRGLTRRGEARDEHEGHGGRASGSWARVDVISRKSSNLQGVSRDDTPICALYGVRRKIIGRGSGVSVTRFHKEPPRRFLRRREEQFRRAPASLGTIDDMPTTIHYLPIDHTFPAVTFCCPSPASIQPAGRFHIGPAFTGLGSRRQKYLIWANLPRFSLPFALRSRPATATSSTLTPVYILRHRTTRPQDQKDSGFSLCLHLLAPIFSARHVDSPSSSPATRVCSRADLRSQLPELFRLPKLQQKRNPAHAILCLVCTSALAVDLASPTGLLWLAERPAATARATAGTLADAASPAVSQLRIPAEPRRRRQDGSRDYKLS